MNLTLDELKVFFDCYKGVDLLQFKKWELENKAWFAIRQQLLCKLFNTEGGLYILEREGIIKKGEEQRIIHIEPHALVFCESNPNERFHLHRAHIITSHRLAEVIIPIFEKMEIATSDNFRGIMENPYKAFLHFADLEHSKFLPQIMLDTANITANASSAGVLNFGATTWANARNHTDGTLEVNVIRTDSNKISASNWETTRQYCFFDATTAVPSGSIVNTTGNTFRVRRFTSRNDTDASSLHVHKHTATDPIGTNDTDFNGAGATSYGSATLASMSSTAETDITLSSAFATDFTPGAINNFGLRNSLDLNNTEPTGTNRLDTDAAAQILIVSFTPAAAAVAAGGYAFVI